MSPLVPYRQHARRHLPGGSDPIPIAAGGSSVPMWPTSYKINLFSAYRAATGWWQIETAPTPPVPNGATLNNYARNFSGSTGTRTAALGDEFFLFERLGPKGSLWGFSAGVYFQSDGGKFTIAAATSPEYEDWAAAGDYNVPGIVGLTYDDVEEVSCYHSGASRPDQVNAVGSFRILGDDGAPHTAFSPSPLSGDGVTATDGGSGLWAFRFYVSGAGLGDGLNVALWELSLHRLDDEVVSA